MVLYTSESFVFRSPIIGRLLASAWHMRTAPSHRTRAFAAAPACHHTALLASPDPWPSCRRSSNPPPQKHRDAGGGAPPLDGAAQAQRGRAQARGADGRYPRHQAQLRRLEVRAPVDESPTPQHDSLVALVARAPEEGGQRRAHRSRRAEWGGAGATAGATATEPEPEPEPEHPPSACRGTHTLLRPPHTHTQGPRRQRARVLRVRRLRRVVRQAHRGMGVQVRLVGWRLRHLRRVPRPCRLGRAAAAAAGARPCRPGRAARQAELVGDERHGHAQRPGERGGARMGGEALRRRDGERRVRRHVGGPGQRQGGPTAAHTRDDVRRPGLHRHGVRRLAARQDALPRLARQEGAHTTHHTPMPSRFSPPPRSAAARRCADAAPPPRRLPRRPPRPRRAHAAPTPRPRCTHAAPTLRAICGCGGRRRTSTTSARRRGARRRARPS